MLIHHIREETLLPGHRGTHKQRASIGRLRGTKRRSECIYHNENENIVEPSETILVITVDDKNTDIRQMTIGKKN